MTDQQPFVRQEDYEVPLLRLLAEMPGGQGETAVVCRLFDERYGNRIPDEDRAWRANVRQYVWYNRVCWNRQSLKDRGFLEMPRRGTWRITEAGKRWLEQNPGASHISGVKKITPTRAPSGPSEEQERPSAREQRQSSATARGEPAYGRRSMPDVTLDMLEQTRSLLPADLFRQLFGPAYDSLLAQERARAITQISQAELGSRARRRLGEIHAFLEGRNSAAPSAEVVCDWIHFCYALDLCREAAALLAHVREDALDTATYRRAKRVAEVCRSKLGG